MGTSTAYGGPAGGTPLVPSWLGGADGGDAPAPPAETGAGPEGQQPAGRRRAAVTAERPPIPRWSTLNASPPLATALRDLPVLVAATGSTWAAPSHATSPHLPAVRVKLPNGWALLAEPARGSRIYR